MLHGFLSVLQKRCTARGFNLHSEASLSPRLRQHSMFHCLTPPKSVRAAAMRDLSKAASLMGRKSAKAREKKWGKKEFVRQMREYGKRGGRPKGAARKGRQRREANGEHLQAWRCLLVQIHVEERARARIHKAGQRQSGAADGGCASHVAGQGGSGYSGKETGPDDPPVL
jgi:hypothetical protein